MYNICIILDYESRNKVIMDVEIQRSIEIIADALIREQYQLSDVGLTSKIAHDWQRAGVYPKERHSRFRRKYNGIEYVWLRLVNELRDFGLPISSILRLKDFLFSEYPLGDFLAEVLEKDDKEVQRIESFLENAFQSKEHLLDEIRQTDIALLNTTFGILLFGIALSKADTHLLIKKNGECILFDDPMKDRFTSSMTMSEPYISFPLKYALQELIDNEHLYELESLEEYIDLSEEEQKVLHLIRGGGIHSLTVRFTDDEINLIETEHHVDLKAAKGKLVDLIKKGGYEEISYKTQDGKIVALNKKTKYKM